MFFCNSLRFTSLRTPTPMAQVQSWTTFTPYYAEDVKYSFNQLTTPLEDEKTLFSLIVATFPSDYENLKERLGVLGADDDTVLRNHWTEAQAWASDRSQSLARCVRGVLEDRTLVRPKNAQLSRGRHNAEEVRQGTVLQQLPAFFLRIICSAD